jgi:cell division septum initiation protein DivIVA
MYRRAEVEAGSGVEAGGGPRVPAARSGPRPESGAVRPSLRRPNLDGDLDQMLDHGPFFGRRFRGYDRFQVDNYVAWAEAELDAARRQCDFLLGRYSDCAAQLTLARRAPSPSPSGPLSRRLGEMLRLASEEAEAITAAAVDEAERIVTGARTEAQARLDKVAGIREAAIAAGDDLRQRARRDADEMLRTAAAERDAAAAEAAARLARVQAEVDDLRRQRDEARESLHRLTAQIGQALQAVSPGDAREQEPEPNIVVDRHPVSSSAS